MAVKMICRACGGTNVMRDAWSCWNEDEQLWELQGEPFDAAHCGDCDGETRIDEVEIMATKETA
jgi:hypothetical protein